MAATPQRQPQRPTPTQATRPHALPATSTKSGAARGEWRAVVRRDRGREMTVTPVSNRAMHETETDLWRSGRPTGEAGVIRSSTRATNAIALLNSSRGTGGSEMTTREE